MAVHPAAPASSEAQPKATAWSPLRQPLFRALWIASVASNTGTWVHDVGAAWLMTSLAPSPLMVALVQTATTLPVFLLALPAGALADIVDRRRLLLLAQGWMLAAAVALGALTLAGATTPALLLVITFALGVGAALTAPAWQAITPELVPRAELSAAVALGSVGFNLARAVGPAIGGFVVAAAGPGAAFLLNAVSFVGVMAVLYRWRRKEGESTLPAERVIGAMRAGARYVRHSPPLRAVLVRAGVFVVCASALWAMLPLLSRQELGLGAGGYGVLLGSIGAGALVGAAFLPKVRARVSVDALTALATALFALTTIALAYLREFWLLCAVMLAGGAAWITMMSSFNVAAQTVVPAWVKARALAVYLLVFQGGMALGGILWGAIATRVGIPLALVIAAAGLIAGLAVIARYRLKSAEGLNLQPSLHWDAPAVAAGLGELEPERGPVMVTVEYLIDPQRAEEFKAEMREVCRERRRDGAIFWGLFVDAAQPGRYVEFFAVESWVEHLRQHERVTVADRDVEQRARAFHLGDNPPAVTHFVTDY